MTKQGKAARNALIGGKLEVVESSNKPLIGLTGQVTNETKNTITIMTDKGEKTLIKDQVTVKILDRTIDGKTLVGRIEARIKQ